jgi:hypothetical protein
VSAFAHAVLAEKCDGKKMAIIMYTARAVVLSARFRLRGWLAGWALFYLSCVQMNASEFLPAAAPGGPRGDE